MNVPAMSLFAYVMLGLLMMIALIGESRTMKQKYFSLAIVTMYAMCVHHRCFPQKFESD